MINGKREVSKTMTKEELEHDHIKEIAENYVNESWGSYLDLDEVDLIMAGIGVGKIIASEQEKRIAELEAQIEQLTYLHNEDVFAELLFHVVRPL